MRKGAGGEVTEQENRQQLHQEAPAQQEGSRSQPPLQPGWRCVCLQLWAAEPCVLCAGKLPATGPAATAEGLQAHRQVLEQAVKLTSHAAGQLCSGYQLQGSAFCCLPACLGLLRLLAGWAQFQLCSSHLSADKLCHRELWSSVQTLAAHNTADKRSSLCTRQEQPLVPKLL